jgi:hypothetical protein
MWRPEEEIEADLASGDAERVAAGLVDLWERMEGFDSYPRPPLPRSVRELPLPEPAQLRLLELLGQYPFEPELPLDERRRQLVAAALGQGTAHVVLEAALQLRGSAYTAEDRIAAVEELASQPLPEAGAWRVVLLLESLLSPPAEREALLETLLSWRADHRGLLERLAPALTDDERARLLG